MGNTIEELRAAAEAAKHRAATDEAVACQSRMLANAATTALYTAEMDAQGIVIGVTKVEHRGQYSWETEWAGPYLVRRVNSSGYTLAKIKRDGTMSDAGTGIYGSVTRIRPYVEGM